MFSLPYGSSIYRVSSGYGWRTHPITNKKSKHHGVDLVGSTKQIYSMMSGRVIKSYYSKSYGNCILIRSVYKKQTYEHLYAHLNRRLVKVGQNVKSGQQIGLEGSTGNSTGSHLHLELHAGPWNYEKTNAVDPLKTIYRLRNEKDKLVEDGIIGKKTVIALQKYLNSTIDGIISGQKRNAQTTKGNIRKVVEYAPGGSLMVRKLQKLLDVKVDGLIGPITVVALSRSLDLSDDQYTFNYPLVKALQMFLNNR